MYNVSKYNYLHKKLQRQISATDSQIDRLVYELYNLTADEIAIIEKSS
jgi:hypothetical protein